MSDLSNLGFAKRPFVHQQVRGAGSAERLGRERFITRWIEQTERQQSVARREEAAIAIDQRLPVSRCVVDGTNIPVRIADGHFDQYRSARQLRDLLVESGGA